MSIYQVKHRLRINNEVHPAGKNISLTDEQAQPLLKAGVVVKLLEPVSPPVPAIEVATPMASNPVAQVGLPSAIAPQPVDTTLATALANATTPTATPEKVAEPVAESITTTPSPTPEAVIETVAETTATDLPSNDNNAYGKLTKAELNAELDKRGITHDAKATNADLEALLVADDSKAK